MWLQILPLRASCKNLIHIYVPTTWWIQGSMLGGKILTVCVVIIWRFFSLWKRATPLIAMLFVSVAPEVNTMSFESAPMRFARCYEILFNGKKREQLRKRHLSSILNSLLSFPSISMCPTMRVTILICKIGQHGVKNSWVNRGRSLYGRLGCEQKFETSIGKLTCISK